MSLLPLLIRELNDDYYRPSRLLDQHFGCGLLPEHLLEPLATICRQPAYYRPWRTALSAQDSGSVVSKDKDKFQISLDVQQFAPNEVSVKTVDNSIVVEGNHEEKQDEHGFISRKFVRRYVLPKGYDPKDIVSSLSSDGILTVTAPNKALEDKSGERVIPITHTGPAKAMENGAAITKEQEEKK